MIILLRAHRTHNTITMSEGKINPTALESSKVVVEANNIGEEFLTKKFLAVSQLIHPSGTYDVPKALFEYVQ